MAISQGAGLWADLPAPDFHLFSGDHRVLDKGALQGKLVVGFYEDRTSTETNGPLKKWLTAHWGSPGYRDQLTILAVADCSEAAWPWIGFWETALKNQSEKLGFTLWGDWSGKMRKDYGFSLKAPNFFIISPTGNLCYQRSGPVPPGDFPGIGALIETLATRQGLR